MIQAVDDQWTNDLTDLSIEDQNFLEEWLNLDRNKNLNGGNQQATTLTTSSTVSPNGIYVSSTKSTDNINLMQCFSKSDLNPSQYVPQTHTDSFNNRTPIPSGPQFETHPVNVQGSSTMTFYSENGESFNINLANEVVDINFEDPGLNYTVLATGIMQSEDKVSAQNDR